MFAIVFDMVIADLKKHYGEPYNNAYYEISNILGKYNFYNTQGSVYLSSNMEDWSDFPAFVKERKDEALHL